jgi:hypothetical protein
MTGTYSARSCIMAALGALLMAGCADVPTGTRGARQPGEPQLLINGSDDFERTAVGAIMVYQPNHPGKPGWRSFCTATLIHKRVLMTAGHCVQFLEQQLNAGVFHAAWISFQQDPLAHFNIPPAEADPASGGWYAIQSLHDNPANQDFNDWEGWLENHPDFHDSGAIILKEQVKGIQPMKLPSRPGEVETLLSRADCVQGADCGLVGVGYGLREFPPPFMPLQARQSAPLVYERVDSLWVWTFQAAPGSSFGATCFGDSGGPIVLQKANGRDRVIVALIAETEDPILFTTCADPSLAALNYRVDTKEHLDFINDVILQSLRGGPN